MLTNILIANQKYKRVTELSTEIDCFEYENSELELISKKTKYFSIDAK